MSTHATCTKGSVNQRVGVDGDLREVELQEERCHTPEASV